MHSNNKKRGAESKRLTQSTLFTFFTQKKQKTKNNETKKEVIIEQVVKEEEERVEIVAKPLSIETEEHSTHIEQKFSNSIYTQEFNDMVQTVLDGEDYLLDEKELDLCCRFVGLKGFFFVKRIKWRCLYINR